MRRAKVFSASAKRFCLGKRPRTQHSQQKRQTVLRSEMPPSSAFPAKVQSGLARNNAAIESISSKGAKRLCIGQCARRHHSQPKCEAVLRKKTRDNKQTELSRDSAESGNPPAQT